MTWNPKSKRGNRISFSEASDLSKCEWFWDQRYRKDVDAGPSQQMMRGTLFHAGAADFWKNGTVDDAYQYTLLDGEPIEELVEVEAETLDLVNWLLERYARHYADLRHEVKVVDSELELTAVLPGTKVKVYGHIDELWEHRGKLWIVERKTYGSRDRIDLVPVDPQITLYAWLAAINGIHVHGIMFDGTYAYQWKPDKPTQKQMIEEAKAGLRPHPEILKAKDWQTWARAAVEAHPGVDRPDADSFDLIPLDRTQPQLDAACDWLRGVVSRRNALRRGATPLRNIGPLCKGCKAKTQCFDALAFPQQIELVSS